VAGRLRPAAGWACPWRLAAKAGLQLIEWQRAGLEFRGAPWSVERPRLSWRVLKPSISEAERLNSRGAGRLDLLAVRTGLEWETGENGRTDEQLRSWRLQAKSGRDA